MQHGGLNLNGTHTAVVTPFTADGSKIDFESFGSLLEFQLAAGVDGIVVCGSTGEAATLSDAEYLSVVKFAREQVKGRVPCVAGVNSSSTQRAVEIVRALEETGVDAALLVSPPYNKPSQEGLYAHFESVRRGSSLPIIAYNIPGRTAVNMLPATIARMAGSGLIVGLKDATGSIDQALDLFAIAGSSLVVLSGEDSLIHALMACGGKGVISATANIIPEMIVAITASALAGRWEESRAAQLEALPVVRAMFVETNPVPVKAALGLKGIIKSPFVRLPLLPAAPATLDRIRSVLAL